MVPALRADAFGHKADHVPAQRGNDDRRAAAVDGGGSTGGRGDVVRMLLRVDRLDVVVVQHDVLRKAQLVKGAQVDGKLAVLGGVAVDAEHGHAAVVAHHGGGVDQRHRVVIAAVVDRGVHQRAQRRRA